MSTHLLHVGSPDKLGSEVEVLSVCLLQVEDEVSVGALEVALVRVEDHGLLLVVFLHHLHGEAMNRRLKKDHL